MLLTVVQHVLTDCKCTSLQMSCHRGFGEEFAYRKTNDRNGFKKIFCAENVPMRNARTIDNMSFLKINEKTTF